jgi:glycosyltransferase involved in cell wall biosynthesis
MLQTITNQSVLYACGRQASYVRNQLLIKQLQQQKNIVYVVCSSHRSFIVRHLQVLWKLLSFRVHNRSISHIEVGFYGYFLVPVIRLLYPRTPISFDAYVSTYEVLKEDRQKLTQLGFPVNIFSRTAVLSQSLAKVGYLTDTLALRLATQVILDTQAQRDYFREHYGLDQSKSEVIYVGYDSEIFSPNIERPSPYPQEQTTILYYGSGLPLQGVETILQAAKICQKQQLAYKFVLIGPLKEKYQPFISSLQLTNTTFIPWVKYEQLPCYIAHADICLAGHFSNIPRAGRVIATKTFQCLGMQKPTIITDNPANRELVNWTEWNRVKKYAIYCSANDPQALVKTIKQTIGS